jgi:hypothetical protein
MVSSDDAIALLANLDIPTRLDGPSTISVSLDGRWLEARVFVRQSPLLSSDLDEARQPRPPEAGERLTLFVVPRLTPAGRRIATNEPGVAVVAVDDRVAIFEGQEFRVDDHREPAPPSKPQRRRPWGRFALIRTLLRTREPRSQSALARECDLTQSAVSQALASMKNVVRASSGWSARDPSALWNDFLTGYPGPGGIATRWHGVAPLRVQAERVLSDAPDALISGDVAADAIAPWRKPRRATLYAHRGVDLATRGFALSSPERATIELVVPADKTIWATASAWNQLTDAANVVDPLIAAWDVRRSGGADADEAIEHLRQAVLTRW